MYLFEAPQQDVKRNASPKSSPKGKESLTPALP